MATASILVASDENCAQVRVIGRATFTSSSLLREFGTRMIEQSVRRIAIDLSECEGMDSTFMGILALIGRRSGESQIIVEVVNAGDNLKRLLGALGLTRLFVFSRTTSGEVDWASLCQTEADEPPPKEQQRTILEAHRELMDVDTANIPKFKDVVAFLEEDLEDDDDK